jgi:phage-related protein
MSRDYVFYQHYFQKFFRKQDGKTRAKILFVLNLVIDLEMVPKTYLKRNSGSQGIYEIRVKHGSNAFRISCFFDNGNIVLMNCFKKKSNKIPLNEIRLVEKLRKEYYEEKSENK